MSIQNNLNSNGGGGGGGNMNGDVIRINDSYNGLPQPATIPQIIFFNALEDGRFIIQDNTKSVYIQESVGSGVWVPFGVQTFTLLSIQGKNIVANLSNKYALVSFNFETKKSVILETLTIPFYYYIFINDNPSATLSHRFYTIDTMGEVGNMKVYYSDDGKNATLMNIITSSGGYNCSGVIFDNQLYFSHSINSNLICASITDTNFKNIKIIPEQAAQKVSVFSPFTNTAIMGKNVYVIAFSGSGHICTYTYNKSFKNNTEEWFYINDTNANNAIINNETLYYIAGALSQSYDFIKSTMLPLVGNGAIQQTLINGEYVIRLKASQGQKFICDVNVTQVLSANEQYCGYTILPKLPNNKGYIVERDSDVIVRGRQVYNIV